MGLMGRSKVPDSSLPPDAQAGPQDDAQLPLRNQWGAALISAQLRLGAPAASRRQGQPRRVAHTGGDRSEGGVRCVWGTSHSECDGWA